MKNYLFEYQGKLLGGSSLLWLKINFLCLQHQSAESEATLLQILFRSLWDIGYSLIEIPKQLVLLFISKIISGNAFGKRLKI